MMKKWFLLAAVCCTSLFAAVAQQPFVCTEPGTVFEFGCYNSKGKLTGYLRTTIEACKKQADGSLEVRSLAQNLDTNRKSMAKFGQKDVVSYTIVRADGMVMPIDKIFASSLEDDTMTVLFVEGDEFIYPLPLSVGMKLPDVASVYDFCDAGERLGLDIRFSVSDREVLAKESITVPAGTFGAYKIAETVSVKFSFMGQTIHNVSWFVPGIGPIREEQRTKSGKIENYTQLLSIQRPAAK